MFIVITIFTALAAILPGLVWLLFFLREDIHPEPKKLILYTFAMGALATIPVLITQVASQGVFLSLSHEIIILIVILALIEEIFKFAAAYWAINKNPEFNEPIDAMIYMIAAALGFATTENLFVIGNVISSPDGFSTSSAASLLLLRFVGATLLHVLASSLVGYYWARGKKERMVGSFVTRGIIIATIVHALFNYLILRFQSNNLLYASIFLVFAGFFVLQDFEKLKIDGEQK
ncbi:MAG: PrsW family glutamic-type intramembrane protease [Patescibacteria group bacterium]